jgi:hypothetical protein
MRDDDDWPRDGEFIKKSPRVKRAVEVPESRLPIPSRDSAWLNALDRIGRGLDEIEKLSASMARTQNVIDNHVIGMERVLISIRHCTACTSRSSVQTLVARGKSSSSGSPRMKLRGPHSLAN